MVHRLSSQLFMSRESSHTFPGCVIEGKLDLQAWESAKVKYDANPVTFSLKGVMKEFDIS